MTPDPEREDALRERVEALLAAAPEPEPARLNAALQSARRSGRRRQHARKGLAWLAAAMLLGAGAATAGWWLGTADRRAEPPVEQRSEPPAQTRQSPGDNESGPNDAEQNGSGGSDSGLIYQGVD
jgi:ferric-dicitrate binding protein FerR (iron transport regulator)